jgi:DNA mismatch repair protein MutL
MRHPYFHRAVLNAYERLVPEGMQPPYFIYFEVPADTIDVNIHPTKTEIKFENEQDIFHILSAAVKEALGKFCDIPSIDFDTEGRPDIPVFDPQRNAIQMPQVRYNPSYNPFAKPQHASSPSSSSSIDDIPVTPSPALFDDVPPVSQALSEKSPEHYQYKGRYIMTAVKSGLMIIDQHRADVRIVYERQLERIRQHSAGTQRILFPEMVQVSPSEAQMMQRFLPDLTAMGFDVSDLGGASFAVNGIPADVVGIDPVSLLRNIVADAAQNDAANASDEEIRSSLALSVARNTAIAYGQVLTNEEMEHVVNDLFACQNVNYTPDGSTILTILPQQDIDRLFP